MRCENLACSLTKKNKAKQRAHLMKKRNVLIVLFLTLLPFSICNATTPDQYVIHIKTEATPPLRVTCHLYFYYGPGSSGYHSIVMTTTKTTQWLSAKYGLPKKQTLTFTHHTYGKFLTNILCEATTSSPNKSTSYNPSNDLYFGKGGSGTVDFDLNRFARHDLQVSCTSGDCKESNPYASGII